MTPRIHGMTIAAELYQTRRQETGEAVAARLLEGAGGRHHGGLEGGAVAGLGELAEMLQKVADDFEIWGAALIDHLQQPGARPRSERLVLAQELLAEPLARTQAGHPHRQLRAARRDQLLDAPRD